MTVLKYIGEVALCGCAVLFCVAVPVGYALILGHYGTRSQKADRVHRRNPDGGAR